MKVKQEAVQEQARETWAPQELEKAPCLKIVRCPKDLQAMRENGEHAPTGMCEGAKRLYTSMLQLLHRDQSGTVKIILRLAARSSRANICRHVLLRMASPWANSVLFFFPANKESHLGYGHALSQMKYLWYPSVYCVLRTCRDFEESDGPPHVPAHVQGHLFMPRAWIVLKSGLNMLPGA